MNQVKSKGTVLLVDDEAYVRESLATILQRRQYRVRTASGLSQVMQDQNLDGLDAVITDLRMPGADGLEVVRHLQRGFPELPVIILTAYGSVASAVECMKAGAYDYLVKPINADQLILVMERALEQNNMRRELEYLRSAGPVQRVPLGRSSAWNQILQLVSAASGTDTTVLLTGESGTGKGEIAKLLHRQSNRAHRPFVRVNCGAIPEDLFESEFFGHRRGAFTGAVADRDGRFRVAHQGTLFMDEISALSLPAQTKILRVLEDGHFERVGESQPTVVDVRLVVASNVDLKEAVSQGEFRQDLFYRINVLPIEVPPLRKRPEDISLLAEFFREEFSQRFSKQVQSIHPETLSLLYSYSWPGNVRELRNVMERGVLLEKTAELVPSSLPFNVFESPAQVSNDLNLRSALAAEEKKLLLEALRRTGGVKREAARLLGIDERNLAYYLKKHQLMRKGSQG